jgi:hypothetical protein
MNMEPPAWGPSRGSASTLRRRAFEEVKRGPRYAASPRKMDRMESKVGITSDL